MPGLFGGFGNYFVPIFQGSPEVVYPRVNNFSIFYRPPLKAPILPPHRGRALGLRWVGAQPRLGGSADLAM